ncbi:MAG: SDR family NAD(P)-dependent oxidoreductase [Alphaproteobacteria bacterium]
MSDILQNFDAPVRAAVIGASGGIGQAFVKSLSQQDNIEKIFAFSRSKMEFDNFRVTKGFLDLTDEASIESAAAQCKDEAGGLNLIIVASGMLHAGNNLPEKSLRDLDMDAMQRCYAVNTFGPALVAKHFLPLIPKNERSVFAALSARVGSISDNRIGGWYSYRASKSALNMVLKNAAIETARRYKHAVIMGLHPGTVDTPLSKPFQGNVSHDIFTPEQSAEYLLRVIDKTSPEESGKCFAWDGEEIQP